MKVFLVCYEAFSCRYVLFITESTSLASYGYWAYRYMVFGIVSSGIGVELLLSSHGLSGVIFFSSVRLGSLCIIVLLSTLV